MIDPDTTTNALRADILAEAVKRGAKLKPSGNEFIGPCPRCGGRDRFAVNTRKKVFLCRRCEVGGDVITLVRHLDGCDFHTAVERLMGTAVAPKPAPSHDDEIHDHRRDKNEADSRLRLSCYLAQKSLPAPGTPVETYLREARGYGLAIPSTIGYLPPTGRYPPAMIATFGIPDEPELGLLSLPTERIAGVHLTRIRADGRDKAGTDDDKITIGSSLGTPIVLAPMNDSLGLIICEGIETGLSLYEATGCGVWAAGPANRMPALADVVPSYADCVSLDRETGAAGKKYAPILAERLRARGTYAEVRHLDDAVGCAT